MIGETKEDVVAPIKAMKCQMETNLTRPIGRHYLEAQTPGKLLEHMFSEIDEEQPDVILFQEVRNGVNAFGERVDNETLLIAKLKERGLDFIIAPTRGDDAYAFRYVIAVNPKRVDILPSVAPERVYANLSVTEPTPHPKETKSEDEAIRKAALDHVKVSNYGVPYERGIMYKKLLDNQSGRLFSVINVHLNIVKRARDRGTEQVMELLHRSRRECIPCLALGDFNTIPRLDIDHQMSLFDAVDGGAAGISWLTRELPVLKGTDTRCLRTFACLPADLCIGLGNHFYKSEEWRTFMREMDELHARSEADPSARPAYEAKVMEVRRAIAARFRETGAITDTLDHAFSVGLDVREIYMPNKHAAMPEDELMEVIVEHFMRGEVVAPSDHFTICIKFNVQKLD